MAREKRPSQAVPSIPALPRPHIQCCFHGCTNNANVRMFTKTGWVNVCARIDPNDKNTIYHYEKVERAPRIIHNPVMDELRAAYKTSPAYQRNNLPVISKARYERIFEDTEREPGSDDA